MHVAYYGRSSHISEPNRGGINEKWHIRRGRVCIGLYRENAIAIESEARDPFGGNVYYYRRRVRVCVCKTVTTQDRPLNCKQQQPLTWVVEW